MQEHAEAAYPEECCGVLIGRSSRAERPVGAVELVLPARNDHPDNRRTRYLIPPELLLAAHKQARAAGLDVLGYYHSHPDRPAVPSETDRQNAWPGVSYVILAVEQGRVAAIRSWRLVDARGAFEEEALGDLEPPLHHERGTG